VARAIQSIYEKESYIKPNMERSYQAERPGKVIWGNGKMQLSSAKCGNWTTDNSVCGTRRKDIGEKPESSEIIKKWARMGVQ